MSAEPAQFRLRAFEQSMLDAMNGVVAAFLHRREDRRGIAMFQGVLAAESRRWLDLGVDNGYFTSEPSVEREVVFEPEYWLEGRAELDPRPYFLSPYLVFGPVDFDGELVAAVTDLGRRDRVEFLYLLFFADEEAWEPAAAAVSEVAGRLAEWPQRQLPDSLLDRAEWALTGSEPSGIAKDCPANWRLAAPFHQELDAEVFASAWRRWATLDPWLRSIAQGAWASAETTASELAYPSRIREEVTRPRREIF